MIFKKECLGSRDDEGKDQSDKTNSIILSPLFSKVLPTVYIALFVLIYKGLKPEIPKHSFKSKEVLEVKAELMLEGEINNE